MVSPLNDLNDDPNYRTGDLVLCKVATFPAWPAVVFPQRYLRNDVYKKRKSNKIAVCFFNDTTYYWELPNKLKRLDSDYINDFLDNNNKDKSNSSNDLINAYKEARDFKSLKEFVIKRCKFEKRLHDIVSDDEIESGEDPFLGISKSKNKKDSKKRSLDNAKPKDTQSDDNTQKKMKKKKKKLDANNKMEIAKLLRSRIQKLLIQRDDKPSKTDLSDAQSLIDKIKDNLYNEPSIFDLDSLRESKLHKLFKVIGNNKDLSQFHDDCELFLIHWSSFITQLKIEKKESLLKQQEATTNKDAEK